MKAIARQCVRLYAPVIAVCAVVFAAPSHALAPGDFCSGDPCVVAQDVVVDGNFLHDYSPAEVRVGAGVTISIADGVSSFGFDAASVVFEPGSSVQALGPGAFVSVRALAGDVVLGTGQQRVKLTARDTAGIEIFAERDVVANVTVDISGKTQDTEYFAIQAIGDIDLAGTIKADGIEEYCNGAMDLDAGGTVTSTAKFVSRGRGVNCAQFGIVAGTAAIAGLIDVSARRSPGADAITMNVQNDLVFTAKLKARGGNDPVNIGGNCDGGKVALTAGGAVTFDGRADLRGGGKLCLGGSFTATAGGDFVQTRRGSIRTGNRGAGALGGAVAIDAGGNAVLTKVDVSADEAGMIDAHAGGTLEVVGRVRARSSALESLVDGIVDLGGECGLTVAARGQVDALSPSAGLGAIDLHTSGGPMAIDGRVKSSGSVTLHHVTGFAPTISGTVIPAPTTIESPPPGTCGS